MAKGGCLYLVTRLFYAGPRVLSRILNGPLTRPEFLIRQSPDRAFMIGPRFAMC